VPEQNEQIVDLNDDQLRSWRLHKEQFLKTLCATGPTKEKQAVENAVRVLYASIDLPCPSVFWCDSPWQLHHAPVIIEGLLEAGLDRRLFRWLQATYRGRLWQRLWANLNEQLPVVDRMAFTRGESLLPLWQQLGSPVSHLLFLQIEGVADIKQLVHPQILTKLEDEISADLTEPLLDGVSSPIQRRAANLASSFAARLKHATDSDIRSQYCDQSAAIATARSRAKHPSNRHRSLPVAQQLHGAFLRVFDQWQRSKVMSQLQDIERRSGLTFHLAVLGRDRFIMDRLVENKIPQELTREIAAGYTILREVFALLGFKNIMFVGHRPLTLTMDERMRLHNASEAAISFADGYAVHAWHGVITPRHVIERPDRITCAEIENQQNAEVRRVMIERYGEARYLIDSGARKVHEDKYGVLYRKEFKNDEPLVMVRVTNSTTESDGSRNVYFIRVPPQMTKAREAVAWTFAMGRTEYNPEHET
jgi:hypothetical protein